MTLNLRKLIVLLLVAAIFVLANAVLLVDWLGEKGVLDLAREIRREYLTGTAITITVVLLILLVRAGAAGRRCSVCDRNVPGGARYCSDCGSRVG